LSPNNCVESRNSSVLDTFNRTRYELNLLCAFCHCIYKLFYQVESSLIRT